MAAVKRPAVATTKRKRASFGQVRQLPSDRWQARYTLPGTKTRITAPTTFDTAMDARAWLKSVRSDMARGRWTPAEADPTTFTAYSTRWLDSRLVRGRPLKPRTAEHYRSLLTRLILPTFGSMRLREITPDRIRAWHSTMTTTGTPTQTAHAYGLVKAILATAVHDDLLAANPCRVRGASTSERASKTVPLSADELTALIDAMPTRYRAMIALAGWGGLRFGELIELRRSDVDGRRGIVHVRRAAVLVNGTFVVGTPKTNAGQRSVHLPAHILPMLRDHLKTITDVGGLLFPAAGDPTKHMRTATLNKVFTAAKNKVGRPDVRVHDLRHCAASLAAQSGATTAELQDRFGWATPSVAATYVHAAKNADARIATALAKLASNSTNTEH